MLIITRSLRGDKAIFTVIVIKLLKRVRARESQFLLPKLNSPIRSFVEVEIIVRVIIIEIMLLMFRVTVDLEIGWISRWVRVVIEELK